MKRYHGEVVEPKDRYLTYAVSIDVSEEVLRSGCLDAVERRLLAEADARARHAAAQIDPDCPVAVTMGKIIKLPDAPPYCERWGVHVRVEFPRYVYDATKGMAEEWEREKIRLARRYSQL